MDFSSFVTSLTTSCMIFLVLMLVFVGLSRIPANSVIYYPNKLVQGLDPYQGTRTRSPIAWITGSLRSSEADIISVSGVDTAVYFVFLSTVLKILVFSGMILLPVLLPLAGTDKTNSDAAATSGNFTRLEKLSMANVQRGSSRLWAFLIATYLVTFTTFHLLWKAYNHVSELRAWALGSPDVKPEQFAVLVRDIPEPPEGETREEQVDTYFRTMHPDTFYKSMVVTDNTDAKRIWKSLEKCKERLAHAESLLEASPQGKRPTTAVGGKEVDSIEYFLKRIDELTPILEAERKTTVSEKQQGAALVFFNSRVAATSAAQSIHAKRVDTWTVVEAPEPRQLIWSNLPVSFYNRQIRRVIIYIIVAVTIFFYMIPIGFISAFTTIDNLRKLLPFMKAIVNRPQLKTVIEAYLPQLALLVFLSLLPWVLMFFSKAEGIATVSEVKRATSGKYFYFIIFNVFLGVTISGTLFTTLKTIQDHPNTIVTMLGTGLPLNATFFLTLVALKCFVGFGLELSRFVHLIRYNLKKEFLCETEADVREAWAPGDIRYAIRVPNDMLIITIVLCYSVIAPIIIPFGFVYFALGWLVLRNQALNVYIPSYESYGRMWPHIHARILAALVIYQITMIGYFGLRRFRYAPLIIPLPFFTAAFAFVCRKRFYAAFTHTPLEVVSREMTEIPNMEQIYKAYIPECLNPDSEKSDPVASAHIHPALAAEVTAEPPKASQHTHDPALASEVPPKASQHTHDPALASQVPPRASQHTHDPALASEVPQRASQHTHDPALASEVPKEQPEFDEIVDFDEIV